MVKQEQEFLILKIIADNGTQSPQIRHQQLHDIFVSTNYTSAHLTLTLKRLLALGLINQIDAPIESLNFYYITAEGLQTIRNHRVCQCKLCQFS